MKFPLSRATRRNLAKNISKVYHTISKTNNFEEPLVELHKYMAGVAVLPSVSATSDSVATYHI